MGSCLLLPGSWSCASRRAESPQVDPGATARLERLEVELGGRVGVFAHCPAATEVVVAHRADERFAMASTFKWSLAAATLELVDRGQLSLGTELRFSEKDLLEYAPFAREKLASGTMTVEEATRAIVTLSDNTAANLLLKKLGGPAGLTQFHRNLGDKQTWLDRNEPLLNMNLPGDERDTTTPQAMARAMEHVFSEHVLSVSSRKMLKGWLLASQTGAERLRAGFPEGVEFGDKTGSGNRAAVNDVGVLWLVESKPIFIASYFSGSSQTLKRLNAGHQEVARIIYDTLALPLLAVEQDRD